MSAEREESKLAPQNTSKASRKQKKKRGAAISVRLDDLDVQAKAMGHQGSPLTEATSDDWVKPTLVYRLSCPGYLTAELEPVPSPELDSTDELTCNTRKHTSVNFFRGFGVRYHLRYISGGKKTSAHLTVKL